jgi:hypothetical protein
MPRHVLACLVRRGGNGWHLLPTYRSATPAGMLITGPARNSLP